MRQPTPHRGCRAAWSVQAVNTKCRYASSANTAIHFLLAGLLCGGRLIALANGPLVLAYYTTRALYISFPDKSGARPLRSRLQRLWVLASSAEAADVEPGPSAAYTLPLASTATPSPATPPGPRVRGVSFSARDHTNCRFPTLFRSISQSWSAGLRRISSVTGVKALSCALRPPLPTMSQRITPLNRIRELFIRWPAFIAVMEANGGASKRPECVSQEPPAWGQEVTRTLTYPLVQQHWLPNDPWSTCTNTT